MSKSSRVPKMTSQDVLSALYSHYNLIEEPSRDTYPPEWGALEEFSFVPGGRNGRVDLFLVRAWGGKPKGHERIVIEVKVSRTDLLNELKAPHKLARHRQYAHRTYFATPKGLIKGTDILPDGVGILEVEQQNEKFVVIQRKRAKRDDNPKPLPEKTFVEAFRRASRAESRFKRAAQTVESQVGEEAASVGEQAALVLRLQEQLKRAQGALDTLQKAADRDRYRLQDWLSLVKQAGGVICPCGKKQKIVRDPYGTGGMSHEDGSHCPYAFNYSKHTVDVDKILALLEDRSEDSD